MRTLPAQGQSCCVVGTCKNHCARQERQGLQELQEKDSSSGPQPWAAHQSQRGMLIQGGDQFKMARYLPSDKRLHNYGKSPFLMGKSTNSMAIFNSFLYVCMFCQRVEQILTLATICWVPGWSSNRSAHFARAKWWCNPGRQGNKQSNQQTCQPANQPASCLVKTA